MNKIACRAPEFLAKSVVYQLFLRPFTADGTLARATGLLEHVASLGCDIVYLCPVTESDPDPRRRYWSPRQQKSGLGNPKNPYRIKDYFRIDPEYGDDAALEAFVKEAHRLKIRVLLDVVYGHCGPNCTVLETIPDFVQRHPNGQIKYTSYHFPLVNFESRAAREYLLDNMEYFVKKFGVDGYRADMERVIPIDFWEAARKRLKKISSDILLLAESDRPVCQEKAYDFSYSTPWTHAARIRVFERQEGAAVLREYHDAELANYPAGARFMRAIDNHDYANDFGALDRCFSSEAVEALLALEFTVPGVPMLYNGVEIADDHRHSIYSDRDHGRMSIAWENGQTARGKARLDFIRTLTGLRRSIPALTSGKMEWLTCDKPDDAIAFSRVAADGSSVTLVMNTRPKALAVNSGLPDEYSILLARGAETGKSVKLKPYGFVLLQDGK